jgi:6-hydroxytryprostatin B O-methyltransferase
LSMAPGYSSSFLVNGVDWASFGEATVVDVGGVSGHISFALAEAFPSLRFVVQDLPD